MDDKINFQIKNFGPINELDMNLSKINIIGGHNATGKSTASKLLYCFLKANSPKRKEFAYKQVFEDIRIFFSMILSLSRNDFEIINNINPYLIRQIRNYIAHSSLKADAESLELFNRFKIKVLYSDQFKDINAYEAVMNNANQINYLINVIEENEYELYDSILNNLISLEFSGLTDINMPNFKNNNYQKLSFDENKLLVVNDVFYIDSVSFFDLYQSRFGFDSSSEHTTYLLKNIDKSFDESKRLFDNLKNKEIISLENRIYDILGGEFIIDDGELLYNTANGVRSSIKNTSSGIKQIGIIQLLLANRKLKENSFLIIDEPEVNLHPEWQFKFAEILVLLAKELDINIYINTHSPMFIEAIEVLTKYHDLENDTNFYLTEKTNDDKFYFVKYDYDELYEIYDNLAKPFDAIEVYRLKAEYKNEKHD